MNREIWKTTILDNLKKDNSEKDKYGKGQF